VRVEIAVDGGVIWSKGIDFGDLDLESCAVIGLHSSGIELRNRFFELLTAALPGLIYQSFDEDFRAPSYRQLCFAIQIAVALGVSLPGDAVRFRLYTSEFIDTHIDRFRALESEQARAGKTVDDNG
jgi:hypothetical protein